MVVDPKFLPGVRAARAPEVGSPQKEYRVPRPERPFGAKLSFAEIKAELRKHGFLPHQLAAIQASQPDYRGHRKCPQCGALHEDTGEYLYFCDECGWCRHAVRANGQCQHCPCSDPTNSVQLSDEHFDVHFVDASGSVYHTERR